MKQNEFKNLRTIRDYKNAGWALTKAQFKTVWPIFLCWTLITAAWMMGLNGFAKETFMSQDGLYAFWCAVIYFFVLWLYSWFVVPAFKVGGHLVTMRMVQEQAVSLKTFFTGFRQRYGKIVWLHVSTSLAIFVWSLFLIIPGMIKGVSYAMAPLVFIENPHMTASEARRESARMMQGHKWEYVTFWLSFIGWEILCNAFPFGLPYVWVKPYKGTAKVYFYQLLKDHQSPKGNLTTDAWE